MLLTFSPLGRVFAWRCVQALFHGATKEELEGKGWVAAQQKAFTKWMNVYLRTRKLRVDSIFTGECVVRE